jgi:hypothetical protein
MEETVQNLSQHNPTIIDIAPGYAGYSAQEFTPFGR